MTRPAKKEREQARVNSLRNDDNRWTYTLCGVLVALIALLIYLITFTHSSTHKINLGETETAESRSNWPPPAKSSGFLRVRCHGGASQQRIEISSDVLIARIKNATLVLPELDRNSSMHGDSSFDSTYDVDHFINSLKFDVRIVRRIPQVKRRGINKKMIALQVRPPINASINWYRSEALEMLKHHGAIYLLILTHRLTEEMNDPQPQYQRLRCRVSYHALKFNKHIMNLSNAIVDRVRAQETQSIHLQFEMDILPFSECYDRLKAEEPNILKTHQLEDFATKDLGQCPLTQEEVGLILSALGFNKCTKIYLIYEKLSDYRSG